MKLLKFYLVIICLTLSYGISFGTIPPPPPTTSSPTCWPPPCIPIDNGLVFLVLAGIGLVLYKFYSMQKESNRVS